MKTRGVHLQHSVAPTAQAGAAIDNPLVDRLSAMRERGSVRAAAAARGASCRHTWSAIKQ
jgi:molybdenum-dependent DNA-binding transcriptional regulator ModE